MNGWIHQALLGEGGGYLLSHFRSTIGVAGFNFSVRNGKRWSPRAMATLVFFFFLAPVVVTVSLFQDLSGSFRPVWVRSAALWKRKNLYSVSVTASACLAYATYTLFFFGGFYPQERVRAISIARLWTLLPLHLQPIYVVVFNDPMWRSYLEEGFVLRCFQHLSCPDADTRQCTWRYNR